jgi:hypothetical protein
VLTSGRVIGGGLTHLHSAVAGVKGELRFAMGRSLPCRFDGRSSARPAASRAVADWQGDARYDYGCKMASSGRSDDERNLYRAVEGTPRYNPQVKQTSAWSKGPSLKFSIGLSLVVGLSTGVYAILWLIGSHPWGVIGPGIFALSSLSNAYLTWRHGSGVDDRKAFASIAFGVAAGCGIIAMWAIANSTGDRHYRESATYFSFWLGLLVLIGLLAGLTFVIPSMRARVQNARDRQAESPDDPDTKTNGD